MAPSGQRDLDSGHIRRKGLGVRGLEKPGYGGAGKVQDVPLGEERGCQQVRGGLHVEALGGCGQVGRRMGVRQARTHV